MSLPQWQALEGEHGTNGPDFPSVLSRVELTGRFFSGLRYTHGRGAIDGIENNNIILCFHNSDTLLCVVRTTLT